MSYFIVGLVGVGVLVLVFALIHFGSHWLAKRGFEKLNIDDTPITIFENEKGHKIWYTDEALAEMNAHKKFTEELESPKLIKNDWAERQLEIFRKQSSLCAVCFEKLCKCKSNK